MKKENEYFHNRIEYEVSYLDKNGKRKEIAISRSETDVDIYSKDNKKMNLQVNFKFIPKTVAEKYNIKNYKDYDSVSYKILESKSKEQKETTKKNQIQSSTPSLIGSGRNILLNLFQMGSTKLLQKGELNE